MSLQGRVAYGRYRGWLVVIAVVDGTDASLRGHGRWTPAWPADSAPRELANGAAVFSAARFAKGARSHHSRRESAEPETTVGGRAPIPYSLASASICAISMTALFGSKAVWHVSSRYGGDAARYLPRPETDARFSSRAMRTRRRI